MKKHAKKFVTLLLVAALLVPTVGMIFGSAVDNSFPVELAYNNLFVFEKWANNELSTTMQVITATGVSTEGATLETDIENGSFVFTKTDMAAIEVFTAYSANTEDPDGNKNYYIIDVEPNTTYTFSYNLSGTVSAFTPYVFFYNSQGLYDSLYGSPASGNGENSFSFTTPADVIKMQLRFTIGDNSTNKPGVASVSATVNKIIIYKTELTEPENIFDFSAWAGNDNSNVLASDYALANGTHSIDEANSSIYFEATGGTFTNFVLGSIGDFYGMAVEPNTTYSVSYSLVNSTLAQAGVAIAWHDASGELIEYVNLYATNNSGSNYHTFVTPTNAAIMQIAFGAFHSGDAGSGTFKDIKICDTGSLFSLRSWAENTSSNALQAGSSGTLNAEPQNNTVTFKSSIFNAHFTQYGSLASADGFYTADVEPNTSYTYHYNVSITGGAPSGAYFEPWFVEFDASGTPTLSTLYHNKTGSVFGDNNYTFTTHSNTTRIMLVFSFHHTIDDGNEWTWTIKDMTLCPTKTFEDITGAPHRGVFTYDHSTADSNFYGSLPTATAPEGYVFGGWYTADGERITPETKIKYSSFSVFSKYERAVDTLEIASLPNNTIYTVGEKLNTAGLSLKATIGETSFIIDSDIYCTPAYLENAGTQTITAHYSGKTATFTVTVLEHETSSIIVNGTAMDDVKETNGKYTLNYSTSAFNRFELAYSTNAYVRGLMTFENGITEEFFLEPSDNGKFYSYIDDFVYGNTHTQIVSVEFTCLDNENGDFELKSIATTKRDDYAETVFFVNDEYELGVSLEYGGVVSELYVLNQDVQARVYKDPDNYVDPVTGNVKDRSYVDYKDKLDQEFEGQTPSATSDKVNLINTLDRGRYLQQSYYGTSEKPYIQGEFNSSPWKYNPVQGGNVGEEPSKLVDYEITDNYIYVKARPMEWEKWSDEHAAVCTHEDAEGNVGIHKPIYGNDVISDTYVEAWYYFEDGVIKVTNRKVDYSGLPEAFTEQEMPALYVVEPLNHFVYNDVTADEAWASSYDDLTSMEYIKEPEFWGITSDYSKEYYPTPDPDEDKNKLYDGYVKPGENWAAFRASEDPNSFGVGIYSPDATKFYYGVMPQIYATPENSAKNYRHAETANPAPEMPTSYIAPLERKTFKSYDPTEYTYYLTTGTTEEIYTDFRSLEDKVADVELAKTKIAVPETVYMKPADASPAGEGLGNATVGQYYVNNIMNENDFYNVETEAKPDETNMYFGIHVDNATSFTVSVTNVTDSTNDIILGNADGTGNLEGQTFSFDATNTFITSGEWSLRFANGVKPNEIATAKWDITVTLDNGTTETFTVYTVLYTPMKTIGAVAESRRNSNVNNEISSWITGANGIDHSQRSPLGQFKGDVHDSGYFRYDPLTNGVPSGIGSTQSSSDYIITSDPSSWGNVDGTMNDDYSENAYVLQTRPEAEDSSRAQSYLGLLMVDSSRYTNTNQIPNFKLGYDYLRVGSEDKNSSDEYNTYYTLGTSDSFTAGATTNGDNMGQKPSGWTSVESYGRGEVSVPSRKTIVPDYDVSTINGKYIHALGWAECRTNLYSRWATAGTSVLCSVTDKSALRDAVLEAYTSSDKDHQSDNLAVSLENAATVLGDPSATQTEIDAARKEINESLTVEHYALKYDNLFSAYEFSLKTDGMRMVKAYETEQNDDQAVLDENATVRYKDSKIIVDSNGTTATDNNVYTFFGPLDNYYTIPVKPDTEYVFEYDVLTTGGSQAHVFVYDDNDNDTTISSGSVKATVGTAIPDPATVTGNENFIGAYTSDTTKTHVVIRFTTSANVAEVAIRFGNIFNSSNTSTFSNIRFVEAKHFSEEIVYSTTEAIYTEKLYEENTAYGELLNPTRIGFTFLKWLYDDEATEVQTTDRIINHTTIYSDWYEHSYRIAYKANGGTGSETTTELNKYTANVTLQNGGFTRTDYILKGWSTDPNATTPDYQLGQTVSRLNPNDNATVTLYAVWSLDTVNITFDNLIDIKAWNNLAPSNATVSNVTDTGFTLTSVHPEGGEGTYSSPFFPVEPGKNYRVEIDTVGAPWDVYIFFCDENGNWIDFADGPTNRYSSYTTWEPVFTAPNKDSVVKAQIRVDANEPANPVTFSNIRVYEDTGISVSPVNKQVLYGDAFGTLPTPTKSGYVFAGWYNGTTLYTSASTASNKETYYLESKWVATEDVLTEDTVVVDFGSPVDIAPLGNDALIDIAKASEASYKIDGISEDGNTYSSTIDGTYGSFAVKENNITYTPSGVVSGIETIHYQASLTSGGVTSTISNTITVAPASNVLYEESVFTASGTGLDWTVVGTAAAVNQDASANSDIYGYDSNANGYNKKSDYSNGSAYTVTVDETNKRSKIMKFDFAGEGFDLNSACGPDTGVLIVTLRNNDTNKMVQSYIVDTYYKDYNGDTSRYGDTLYQVPVISENGLDYANYTVQIVASYLPSASGAFNSSASAQVLSGSNGTALRRSSDSYSASLREALAEIGMEYVLDAENVEIIWMDENSVLNGGNGTNEAGRVLSGNGAKSVTKLLNVIDSVRVYKPVENADAYYIASEQNAVYYNVMDNLVNKKENSTITGIGDLFAYIIGKDSEAITIETYEANGPKDELYLAKSDSAVTFSIKDFNKNNSRAMISLRAAAGTPKAKIGSYEFEVKSSTEMYYDITDYIGTDGTVTIQNSNSGTLLSVGSLKITSTLNQVVLLSNDFDLATASAMMMAPAKTVEPNTPVVPEEPTVPEVTVPEVTVPEVTVPEVTEPEVTEPEVTEPEVTEPEVTEPEVTEPEVTEPEVTEPEVTEPEVTEPEVTEPEVTEPEVTEPEVTEPEVTEPEVTEPEVTEPEVTEPEVTEPEVTEPEVTEPEVTEPEVTEPEVTEPGADEPDETEPSTENNTAPEEAPGDDDEEDSLFVKIIKFIIETIKKVFAFIVSIFC